MRRLVARTSVRPADLIQPLFVKEGISEPQPVGSMPGVLQHTRTACVRLLLRRSRPASAA
jgi:porphobilinogen synthase